MKWILGAVLALVVGWYFANDMLQAHGLAIVQDGQWKIIASGWKIIPAMWPIWGIIALAFALFCVLFAWYFTNNEEKLALEYEVKLKQTLQDAPKEDKKLIDEVLYLSKQETILTAKIRSLESEKEGLVSKINHQHSTIQRLYKKIEKLNNHSF